MSHAELEPGYTRESSGLFVRNGLSEPPGGFDARTIRVLANMQERHFWYRGRTKLLLDVVSRLLDTHFKGRSVEVIDFGAGAGGFIRSLTRELPGRFSTLAIADASRAAIEEVHTLGLLPDGVTRFQVDLLDLGFDSRWDLVFALDVLEHVPDDDSAFCQIAAALRPGGLFVMTAPALNSLWTSNDQMAGHFRRYARKDLARRASTAHLELLDARYFMFILAPALWLSRKLARAPKSDVEIRAHLERTHRVPPAPLNSALAWLFELETPLGRRLEFPWGTSVLGVFRKP